MCGRDRVILPISFHGNGPREGGREMVVVVGRVEEDEEEEEAVRGVEGRWGLGCGSSEHGERK